MLHLADVAAVDLPAADRIDLGGVVVAEEVPSPHLRRRRLGRRGAGGTDGVSKVNRNATNLNVVIFPWYIAKKRSFNGILPNMPSFDGMHLIFPIQNGEQMYLGHPCYTNSNTECYMVLALQINSACYVVSPYQIVSRLIFLRQI